MKSTFGVNLQGLCAEGNGQFVGINYVPKVIDRLMNKADSAIKHKDHIYRMRITVEVEDLGADIQYDDDEITPAVDIDPAPEVVA